MSAGMNRAYLVGTVGRVAESRATVRGDSIVSLSIAVPRAVKMDDTFVESPEWFTVKTTDAAIGQQLCAAAKGAHIAVECALRPMKWTDRDGHAHHDIALHVDRVLWIARAA